MYWAGIDSNKKIYKSVGMKSGGHTAKQRSKESHSSSSLSESQYSLIDIGNVNFSQYLNVHQPPPPPPPPNPDMYPDFRNE